MATRSKKRVPKPNGRPPHQPTEQSRRFVEALTADGTHQEKIAGIIGIDEKTLRKWYPEEIKAAGVKANLAVSQTLLKCATGGGGPDGWKQANITAAIWWDKTRNGKSEPKHQVEHSGAVGNYDLTKISDADLAKLETILTSVAKPGGRPSGAGEEDGGEASPI